MVYLSLKVPPVLRWLSVLPGQWNWVFLGPQKRLWRLLPILPHPISTCCQVSSDCQSCSLQPAFLMNSSKMRKDRPGKMECCGRQLQ
jgi:hypothetical protein